MKVGKIGPIALAGVLALRPTPQALAQEDFPPPPAFNEGEDIPDFTRPAPTPSNSGGSVTSNKKGMSKDRQEQFNQAGLEEITEKNFPETIESFDFPNADITDVIKAISELTGKNFIIDPGVRGKITIIAPSKITVAEAYRAFLSALAINGFTVVPMGNFLKVKSSRNAQRDNIETYSGAYYPNSDAMITRIIHLKHISAEQVFKELRMLTSKDGEANPYPPTNSLIISDYGANIDRVMKILAQLDVPGFDEQIEVIPIKYAKAKEIAELMDKIINRGQSSSSSRQGGTYTAGTPRMFGGNQGNTKGSSYFMAIPDDRTNTLIVTGNKAGIERVKRLVSQLDFRISPEDTGGVFVYYVKYGEAEKIAQVLQGIAKEAQQSSSRGGGGGAPFSGFNPPPPTGGSSSGSDNPASAAIFGGDVRVTADKNTNSLVIVASKQDYEVLKNLLSKIDIPRDQVFVEAIIMEMSMGDGVNWGLGYYRYGDSGYGKAGFNGGINLNDMLSPTGGTGAVLGFGSSQTVTVTDPVSKQTITIPNLIGFINFLKTTRRANILSTPQITAMDNQEATIEVGDRVATGVNTTTSSTGTTVSPILEDATIKLTIKPFISPASESIRMEINQVVKQLTSGLNLPKALADNSQPLASRNIKTVIVVNNGDTAVLGGLMKDNEIERVSKVPLLGDLPIIGWLFKSRELSKEKTNMVVFLTPKIIRSSAESGKIVGEKLDQRLKFVKDQGGRDPHGDHISEIEKRIGRAAKDGGVKKE
ncbi:MAG: type II secretion system secretin GspD [Bdellovibrionaceae bacterium]|nr:type II secretion system secretin GspD [Pseudobdellovibrionaceae bacterium]